MKRKMLFYGTFGSNQISGNGTDCIQLERAGLFDAYEVVKIDSSLKQSQISRNFLHQRLLRVGKRAILTLYYGLFHKPDVALIFFNNGWSLIEKGVYGIFLKTRGVRTIIAPRSGLVQKEIDKNWFEFILNKVVSSADLVIVQGQFWKAFYSKYTSIDKLRVVPNWIEYNSKLPEHKVRTNNFVFIGWLKYYKNVACLVDAAAILAQKSVDFQIEIYGSGPEEESISEYILKKGVSDYIKLKGWADAGTKEKIWTKRPVLVLPSLYEGMPNIILEAINHGLPVIASDISTHPQLIKHKKSGLIFKSNDPLDLSSCLFFSITNAAEMQEMASTAHLNLAKYDISINGQLIAKTIEQSIID